MSLANRIATGLLIGVLAAPALAQPAPIRHVFEPYFVDSSAWNGESEQSTAVFVDEIRVRGTPWIRIHIADYELGAQSFLTIRSLADGDVQRFDARSLPQWSNWSAIFRGDAVALELHVAPNERDIFVQVDEVQVADPLDRAGAPAGPPQRSICGDLDDRVPSSDSRVGRLFFGGCTGWLVSTGGVLTAGHCGTPDGNITGVIEFNVPPSQSNGTPVPAAVNDQYPVAAGSAQSQSGGEGADWAVFSINANSNTGLQAHRVQGFFRMTWSAPAVDTTLRVTGYGLDNRPAGSGGGGCCDADGDGNCENNCNSASLTQQTDTGRMDSIDSSIIEHEVDTTPANSGSPIVWNANGFTIGIHTNGGCDDIFSENDNAGTRFTVPALYIAVRNNVSSQAVFADNAYLISGAGWPFSPYTTIPAAVSNVPDGGLISIVAGSYPAASGNTFVAGADGKAMTLTAPVGTVVIGN